MMLTPHAVARLRDDDAPLPPSSFIDVVTPGPLDLAIRRDLLARPGLTPDEFLNLIVKRGHLRRVDLGPPDDPIVMFTVDLGGLTVEQAARILWEMLLPDEIAERVHWEGGRA